MRGHVLTRRAARDLSGVFDYTVERWDMAQVREYFLHIEAAFEQIVDNLLANAIAAVPPGTAIDLEASVVDGRPELRVVDHGPGMAPDVRARARQRHWHERAGGSGLGLAIVDRLCRHDRAELVLDETSGGGLTARIRFPPTAPTP